MEATSIAHHFAVSLPFEASRLFVPTCTMASVWSEMREIHGGTGLGSLHLRGASRLQTHPLIGVHACESDTGVEEA